MSAGQWGTRLVGRGEELARLDAERRRAGGGTFTFVLVTGQPGIGKTRLVTELLARGRNRFRSARGSAYPLGAAASFGVWTGALEPVLRDLPPAEVTELCGGYLDDLAGVLRAVAAARGSAPDRDPPRPRVLEAFAVLLRNLSRRLPLVVALDDVHQADASSWELLAYLANAVPDARLLVVATARGPELARSAAGGVLLAMEQAGVVRRIEVGPLGDAELAELAAAVLGEAAPDTLVRWLSERSLGNPLFALGLLDALREQGIDVRAPALPRVPDPLRDRVATTVSGLSARAQEVLEVLAVVARPAEIGEIAGVVGQTAGDLAAALTELTRARLLVEDERAHLLLYEIAHPLIRDAVYEGIGAARRRGLHRAVARCLLDGGSLGQSAAHFARSASPGDDEAIAALLSAVHQAETRGLHREALPILESLVELLPPGDERWIQALDAMSRQEEFVYRGNAQAAIRAMRTIVSVLEGCTDPVREAAAKFRLATFLAWGSGELQEAEDLCRQAAVLFGLAGERRRALLAENEVALIQGLRGDFAALTKGAALVAEAAAASGERFVTLQAIGAHGYGAFGRGRFDEAAAAFRRTIELARDGGSAHRLIVGLGSLAGTLAFEGRIEAALPLLEEARLLDPAFRESLLLAWETCIWWVAGNYPAALTAAREDVMWNESRRSRRRAGSAVFAALAAVEADRAAEAHGFLAAARHVWGDEEWAPHSQLARWAEAVVGWRSGSRDATVDALRRAVDSVFATDAWALAAFPASDLAEVAQAQGEPAQAREAADLLDVMAARIDRPLYHGLAALARGWAELAAGDAEQAVTQARRSEDLLAATGCRSFTGRALELRGRAQARIDRRAAVATLEAAAGVFAGCGAAYREGRSIELMRRLGRPGRRRAAAARGPGSLTLREREVAVLAIAGKTTREIAAALLIGERTVETHLDNVYAKLGVESRLELVRHAPHLSA